jgi:hypothetical protein
MEIFSKKQIRSAKGERLTEVTYHSKKFLKEEDILKQIQKIDKSIANFQAEKERLLILYDEIKR